MDNIKDLKTLMVDGATDEDALRRLIRIIEVLRAPGGCPWDIEQTHDSLIRPMIEEAYEVVEAIEKDDMVNLREELGDVLLQVVFHSDIEREKGSFTIKDVANEECNKMINRHPHVFKEKIDGLTAEGVLANWEVIKSEEKKDKSQTASMKKIPRGLPALLRADKVQAKAAKVGFDWPDVSGAFEKVAEETLEIKEAMKEKDQKHIFEEVGDLLFAAVNVARFLDVDPEKALNHTTEKFMKRFSYVEETAQAEGKNLSDMTLKEMDELWEKAKNL